MEEKRKPWHKVFNFDKQSPGYTPMHISRSDQNPHVTFRGQEHTVHVYGKDLPFPLGNSPDKWFSKKKRL